MRWYRVRCVMLFLAAFSFEEKDLFPNCQVISYHSTITLPSKQPPRFPPVLYTGNYRENVLQGAVASILPSGLIVERVSYR